MDPCRWPQTWSQMEAWLQRLSGITVQRSFHSFSRRNKSSQNHGIHTGRWKMVIELASIYNMKRHGVQVLAGASDIILVPRASSSQFVKWGGAIELLRFEDSSPRYSLQLPENFTGSSIIKNSRTSQYQKENTKHPAGFHTWETHCLM